MELPSTGTWLRFGLLVAAAVASTALFLNTRPPSVDPVKARLTLAYYLDQAELTGTGPDGETLYRVRTARASHVVDDDSIAMTDVEMIYTPDSPEGWNLNATRGRIPADANVIELTGKVVVTPGEKNTAATTITTDRLDVDPATRQARTSQPVVVDYEGQIVNAVGMEADLKRNRVKLLSDVNGEFAPVVK
jgi:LPS export ABC transporter protein LptC